MKLFRGVRHPNGRTDVQVCTWRGDTWLRPPFLPGGIKVLCYDWGKDSPQSRLLAYDLLCNALPDRDLADEYEEAFHEEMVMGIAADRWAIADWEIIRWYVGESDNRLAALRDNPYRGGTPCPSEN